MAVNYSASHAIIIIMYVKFVAAGKGYGQGAK